MISAPLSHHTYIPPRMIRMALTALGATICIGGMTIASIGLSHLPRGPLPFWLHKTITVLTKKGCIALLFASYIMGSLLTELGRDPIHSQNQAKKNRSFKKMIDIITRIPRFILALLIDIVLLFPYGVLLLRHRLKAPITFDQIEVDGNKPTIVLIHGSNSNAGVWDFGKYHLNKKQYGKVVAINLEEQGQIFHPHAKGIHEFAQTLITKLSQIPHPEGTPRKFIFICHSMGGLVGSYAAENLAEEAGLLVDHIFTNATPWQGSPTLDFLPNRFKAKRLQHMTETNQIATSLLEKVTRSHRHYYIFGSSVDCLVPSPYSTIPRIESNRITYLGHLGMVALPPFWRKISPLLDRIY